MTPEQVGALFLERDAEIEVILRRWLNVDVEDAKHEVLIHALETAVECPTKEAAWALILTLAASIAADHYWERRGRNRRFPSFEKWPLKGTRLGERAEENPLERFPDTRPDPEEEAVRKEAEEAIAALGRRLGHDPTWRGEMYQLLYVEGLTEGQAAKRLGITPEAAWQRAKRLRDYLRETPEGARIRKGGRK